MKNNNALFLEMIPEETTDKKILTLDERQNILNKKIENIKEVKEWAGDMEISGMCLMLNININMYIKDDIYYKPYFKFEGSEFPTERIDTLYVNSNHFNFLFKRNKLVKLNNIITESNIEQDEHKIHNEHIENTNEYNEKHLIKEYLINIIINKNPDKKYVIKNNNSNINNIGKGIYVDHSKNIYIDKYNDIYKFLSDNKYVP